MKDEGRKLDVIHRQGHSFSSKRTVYLAHKFRFAQHKFHGEETLAACDPRVYAIPQLVVLLILTCTFPYDKITQLK